MFSKYMGEILFGAGMDTRKFERGERRVRQGTRRMARDFERTSGAMRSMGIILTGVFSLEAARRTIIFADQFAVLERRIRTATAATGDYAQVSERLLASSNRIGVEFQPMVNLFQALSRVAPELGATNQQMLALSETVASLGVIGGSTAYQMRNGLLQFTQAMASGILRAEEMNSILENTPEIAVRIANALGTNAGNLRMMVLEGAVSSQMIFDAMMKIFSEVRAEMSMIPANVERAINTMKNSFAEFLGEFDKATGFTVGLAEAMNDISQTMRSFDISDWLLWLETVPRAVLHVGALAAAVKALAIAANIAVLAFRNLRVAMMATGAGLFIVAFGEVSATLEAGAENADGFQRDIFRLWNKISYDTKLLGASFKYFTSMVSTDFGVLKTSIQITWLRLTDLIQDGLDLMMKGVAKFVDDTIELIAFMVELGAKAISALPGIELTADAEQAMDEFRKVLKTGAHVRTQIDEDNKARKAAIDSLVDERRALINNYDIVSETYDKKIAAAEYEYEMTGKMNKALWEQIDLRKNALSIDTSDYGYTHQAGRGDPAGSNNISDRMRRELDGGLSVVSKYIYTKEEMLDASYKKHMEIIEKAENANYDTVEKYGLSTAEMRIRLEEWYQDQLIAIQEEGLNNKMNQLEEQLAEEQAMIRDAGMAVIKDLRTDNEAAKALYEERTLALEQMVNHDQITWGVYTDNLKRANKDYQLSIAPEEDRQMQNLQSELDNMRQGFMTKQELAAQAFVTEQDLLQQFLDTKLIQQEEFERMSLASAQRYNADIAAENEKKPKMLEDLNKQEKFRLLVGAGQKKNIDEMTAQEHADSFQKQIDMAAQHSKKFFEIKKAMAMAEAAINAPQAILSAYAFGSSMGGPPLGAIMAGLASAATAIQIASIASAQFKGGRAMGGSVSPGAMYEVNEKGPELLSSGGKDYLMMGAKGGTVTPNAKLGGNSKVVVNVYNQPGQTAQVQESPQPDGSMQLDIMIEQIENTIANGVARGSSALGKVMENKYALNPAAGAV